MKKLITFLMLFIFVSANYLNAEVAAIKKTFSKKDILLLADAYINNNLNVKNPMIVDVDKDGDFDILNFNNKGNVEYYKNEGTLEKPFFVLENKKYDNYEMNSFLPNGIPIPAFFADKDGDNDTDIFGIVTENSKYNVLYAENTVDFDHYTLITIILVLLIIVLLVAIL